MPTLSEVRHALAEQIASFHQDTHVKWYTLLSDDSAARPRISIETREVLNTSQGGAVDLVLAVVVEPAPASDESLALAMDRYLDRGASGSVFEAIESDLSLGGLVADMVVGSALVTDPGRAEIECRVMFL